MSFIIYAPIFHLPQFLIGVCTVILFLKEINNEQSVVNQTYQKVSIAVAACFLIIFVVLSNIAGIPYEILNNGLFSPLFPIVIFALAFGRGLIVQFLSLPLFILLGEPSYAIYLLQNPVLSFLKIISN